MDAVAIIAAGLRGAHLLALASLFGAMLCAVWVTPTLSLVRLGRCSLLVTLVCGTGWFAVETVAIGQPDTLTDYARDLLTVAGATRFGHVVLIRLGALLPLWYAVRRSPLAALTVAGMALAAQGLVGHAGAAGGTTGAALVATEALHVLAAAAWLGSLLPLWLALRCLPQPLAVQALQRFSPIGMAAVMLIAGSALFQAATLIGGVPALLGTAYGWLALVKLALFAVLLALAARNRFSLTDRVAAGSGRTALQRSVAIECVLGGAVIAAAAFLASTTPGAHEQPIWPFAWRLDPEALAYPASRQAVAISLAAIGGGTGLLGASLAWRRGRGPAALLLLGLGVWRVPPLAVLLTTAYPTSFYRSSTGFTVGSIVQGQTLFAANCAACHGATGHGNGPAAASLAARPTDLTASQLLLHSDGELFWRLTAGFSDADGRALMPAFGEHLTQAERWNLIDFLRANAVGQQASGHGRLAQPIPAPAVDIACPNRGTVRLVDMIGAPLRLLAVVDSTTPPPIPGVGSVLVSPTAIAGPTGSCVTRSIDAWAAFAILAGLDAREFAGTALLVDPNGLLRAAWWPGEAPPPPDAARAVHDICATPLPPRIGVAHEHHP